MKKNISDAVTGLRIASTRLNMLTDKAAAVVKQVEKFLNDECHTGVEASVLVSEHYAEDEPGRYVETRDLVYCRIGQRFRIAVDWRCDGADVSSVPKPWSDCTREDKLETLEKLPDLLHAIAERLGGQIKKAEKSLATASAVTDALFGKGG